MPIFEYLCHKCGTKEELIRSYNASHEVTCDDCGNIMEKLISSTGTFRFKLENGGTSSTYAAPKVRRT